MGIYVEMVSTDGRTTLPGFGMPIDYLPEWTPGDKKARKARFPHAIADFVASEGVTVRERRMLEFITQITDKPEWDRKVFDETIVVKWRDEALQRGDAIFSTDMFDYCIAELRDKSERYRETKFVAVMDAEATVVKGDSIISSELRRSLSDGVKPLEDVPEHQKDWHPGSDNKVLDLVHPSLFPLVYGLSRVLPYGTVPLDRCVTYTGKGEITEKPGEGRKLVPKVQSWGNSANLPAWGNYQWLPSDICFSPDGHAKINSYINSLHPTKHEGLYKVLENFVDLAIPLWDETLSWFHNRIRIRVDGTSDEDYEIPEGIKFKRPREDDPDGSGTEVDTDDDDFDHWDDDYVNWKRQHRVLTHPQPVNFVPFAKQVESKSAGAEPVELRKEFASSGLQIIFKLANIHLTPEKPEYEGGSWHIEGALNEHICATALYYYDQENVTDSYLQFRQSIDAEEMTMKPAQNEWDSLEEYYGIVNEEPAIQELGRVLTREGRLLTFPNVLQHCVQSFRLADPTKPGHRKLLAMFLVDPHIRVLSTANVPPQSKDWWAEEVRKVEQFEALPRELFDKIIDEVQGFPIPWDEALEIRESLMGERGAMTSEFNEAMENETFYFCEH